MGGEEKLSCISIVVCDDIYRDESTKKLIIIGTFNNIFARGLPCRHPRMVILFTLTNGRGTYDLKLTIEHARTGRVVAGLGGPLEADDPLAITDFTVKLHDLRFAEDGKYWVVLKADEEIIQQRPFNVALVKEES